jgi:hypothetical protein
MKDTTKTELVEMVWFVVGILTVIGMLMFGLMGGLVPVMAYAAIFIQE